MDDKKLYMHLILLIIVKYTFNSFAYNYIPRLNLGGDQLKILLSKIANTIIKKFSKILIKQKMKLQKKNI